MTALLDRILELDKAATKGPWKSKAGIVFFAEMCKPENNPEGDYAAPYGAMIDPHYKPAAGFLPSKTHETADLIATYRTAAPALARALKIAVEALEKIAGHTPGVFPPGTEPGLALAHERAAAAAKAAIAKELEGVQA